MNFKNNYTFVDRALHRLAFSTQFAQLALADLESTLFSRQWQSLEWQSPIFITALPRAGTTILLEILEESGLTASHTYRDMPFILSPVLWSKFSGLFGKDIGMQERAHGDGIFVGMESPEAFEEILWLAFWKKQYDDASIKPWIQTGHREFEEFFIEHMKKVIFLHAGDNPGVRYLSKNNLNISRVPYLSRIFPQGKIIIPFRDPCSQAQSLLQQHQNFLKMHHDDNFARDYMRDIGHFDFGENLKPVNFNEWLDKTVHGDSQSIEFWWAYWIATYGKLIEEQADNVGFFSYEMFCKEPGHSLDQLAVFTELRQLDIQKAVKRVRVPQTPALPESLPDELKRSAYDIFNRLSGIAVNRHRPASVSMPGSS